MNRSLVAQFVLRLQDRASAGLSALQRRLQGLAQVARRVALFGGLGAALTLAGPLREAAAFDDTLRQMGMTAGLTGTALDQFIARQSTAFQRLALQTGQTSQAIGNSASRMAAAGLSPELVDRFSPIVARFATATGAQIEAVGEAVIRMNQNLKIESVEEMQGALAALLQSSRDGSVEIGDMARILPSLTAQMEALNVTGRPAVNMLGSLLQVAARGAATSAEAGNNLANFLTKLTSPETVNNFRDLGVNIEAVMADAARRSINPIEAIIQKVREVSGGNMFRVGQLFADGQVLAFLRPMMGNVEEYLALVGRARGADTGLVDQGFEDRVRGLTIQLALLTEGATQFGRRLGVSLTPAVTLAAEWMKLLVGQMETLDAAFPGLIGGGAALALGVIALTAAFTALHFLLAPLAGALALITSPIGLVVAGVATLGLAAWALWKNWEPIAGWFVGLWNDLGAGVYPQIDFLLVGLGRIGAVAVAALRAAWEPLTAWFAGLWEGIRAPFDAFITGVLATVERVRAAIASLGFAGAVTAGGPAVVGNVQQRQAEAAAARGAETRRIEQLALAGGGGASPRPQPVNGEIIVRAAPGAEIVSAEGSNTNVPLTAGTPDRGATRSRP